MMITTAVMVAALVAPGAAVVEAQEEVRVHTGVIDGAQYRVEVPSKWNGKVLIYSHGIYPNGYIPEQIELTNRVEAKPVLLERGYALAASLYSKPHGLSVREAVHDQGALLTWFTRNVGQPRQVLAWGASGGGLNSVVLGEKDRRIDGVLAMCGPVAGGTALFNQFLDIGFTVRTLLAPELEIVRIANPAANLTKAHEVVNAALATASGRARLALANSFASVPGWSRTHQPRSTDVAEQIRQQTRFVAGVYDDLIWGDLRSDVEITAGGNPSWNIGVDYGRVLSRASERNLVEQAYREAGMSLAADLDKLAAAPRITPDWRAVETLTRLGTPMGRGKAPVVTLHPVGDGVAPEHERTYGARVDSSRIRQLYVNRGGHCMHSAAEELTALGVLEHKVNTGRWPDASPEALNATAGRYGPQFGGLFDWLHNEFGVVQPAFVRFQPAYLPR
ncbi:hypothetical protein [Kibdelosporangium aridum]|uniref:Alpha/beta hydrolase n=1 Tax=Kibdelosporangium aridum TaxID=2030 RepID=A0A1W2DRB4_KIBAR|nr:hypothetical protein [Kibdelosporangium aridum]SMC99997.1 hypothetical protein SAMN05661093_03745 [Kibdelosporangium aridum]